MQKSHHMEWPENQKYWASLGILDGRIIAFLDDEKGLPETLWYNSSFNTTLAPLHEGYEDRVYLLFQYRHQSP